METERLILRLYGAKEKSLLIELFTDEDVMKHVDTGVFSIEKAEALWKKLIEDFYPKGKNTIYGVFSKDRRTLHRTRFDSSATGKNGRLGDRLYLAKRRMGQRFCDGNCGAFDQIRF